MTEDKERSDFNKTMEIINKHMRYYDNGDLVKSDRYHTMKGELLAFFVMKDAKSNPHNVVDVDKERKAFKKAIKRM